MHEECFCLQVPPEFLGRFQDGDAREFVDAWNQALDRQLPPPQLPGLPQHNEVALFREFESIYGQEPGTSNVPPVFDGQWLVNTLTSFWASLLSSVILSILESGSDFAC